MSSDLLDRQRALQAGADALDTGLRLTQRLAGVGDPVRVGSAALGLMVQRDLDITVVCTRLAIGPVAALGAELAGEQSVRQVVLRDDTGAWNCDPDYPDGIYLGVTCRDRDEERWTVDIWFVDEPERQPDLAHLRTLPLRLTEETRLAILRLKTYRAGHDDLASRVRSADIYRAVLDDGVRTPADLDRWVAR